MQYLKVLEKYLKVLEMQSQKQQNDLCSFPGQTIQYHSHPSLYPTSNAEEAEVEQDLLELAPPKDVLFIIVD